MRAIVLAFCAFALVACTEARTPVERFDPASVDVVYDVDFWDQSEPCGEVQGPWPTSREVVVPLEIDREKEGMILAFDRTLFLELPPMEALQVGQELAVAVYRDDRRPEPAAVLDGRFFPNLTPGHAHGSLEISEAGCLRSFFIHGDARTESP